MKTRQYFIEALRSFLRCFNMLGRGLYALGRHLFLNYPNPTWGVIVIIIASYSILKLAQARSERDSYSLSNAQLIEQIDSLKAISAR